jgi:steroid 5-alpha reductase family enzyme
MYLLSTFMIAIGINVLMFIPAYFLKTDKLTDISYAVTFVVVAVYGMLVGGYTLPSLLIVLMVFAWAGRLGGYLLIRIKKIKRDKRFDGMRESFWRFSRFWLLQGLTVWVVLLPSLLFFQKSPEVLPAVAYLGIVVWLVGLMIEGIADQQKYAFINDSANKGKWIDTGLWKYSQHPNYFGEITLWIGVYIYAIFGLNLAESLVALLGPLYLIVLLIFVSGIPLLDKAAKKRWGDNDEYQEYRKRTSKLIPLPNKKQ